MYCVVRLSNQVFIFQVQQPVNKILTGLAEAWLDGEPADTQ